MGRFHNGVDSNRFQNRTVQASESTLESTQSRLHYTKIKMFHRKNYPLNGQSIFNVTQIKVSIILIGQFNDQQSKNSQSTNF